MDDGGLVLVRQEHGRIVEWIEIDVRELPDRPDLLTRLGPKAKKRLLADAAIDRARAAAAA